MRAITEMARTNPQPPGFAADTLAACIQACIECAQTCGACADACLGEPDPKMLARCIRLNLDGADVCEVTARMLSRQFQPDVELLRRQVELCALACASCGTECERHAKMHEHCRICSEACRSVAGDRVPGGDHTGAAAFHQAATRRRGSA